ncbi:MAG: ATP-binding cassette domain-containing protein, partial [Candidatus Thermoplasmatota archaeon]
GETVLRDVSFEIPRGGMVALVGASGSGKSTSVQLVARLADPTLGSIRVDGVDLRDLRVTTWRRRLAVVSQDTFLFNTSVRENIRFGRLDATDQDIEEAAKLAEAHEFISNLEQGYDTPVGDRGVRLSGGQAQRLAIARALLADPELLILDEATSALDTATERSVQRAIERASRDRTVLAIAHRLSTVRHADEIIVLEKGVIVERGTHADLMARRGQYFSYVQMQDLTDEATAPETSAALPATPQPARFVRLVFGADGKSAFVVDARGHAHTVHVFANGSAPNGDSALVEPGAHEARIVIEKREYDGIPIYQLGANGKEIRSRVVQVR